MINEFIQIFKINFQLFFLCLLISTIYLFLSKFITPHPHPTNKPVIIQVQQETNQIKLNAFIITATCNSKRFNATKQNIEQAFPNFFNILCYLTIPLNDSRIHTSNLTIWKKFSSNLLAFIQLWTYEIPKLSKNELDWSFIFEDDVNFVNSSKFFQSNYIESLQEFMFNNEIHYQHGFFYLGICGPLFFNETKLSLISKNTNNSLISWKGYGYCLHASAITAKRSRLFWTKISSYYSNSRDSSLDLLLKDYSVRSKNYFYTFGANFEYPPGEEHFGIAYQDRGRLITTIT